MPEGVEIRWTAKCLQKQFIGLQLLSIQSSGNKQIHNLDMFKPGVCSEIGCKGKVLYFKFNNLYLICGFGLTGFFSIKQGLNNLRYTLHFLDKKLYYYDAVNFGRLEIVNGSGYITKMNNLGIDVFGLTYTTLNALIERKRTTNICVFLLDQKLIAGIGNYAKCEILYHSNISPYRTMGSLGQGEIKKLFSSILFVIYSCYFAGFSVLREKEHYNIFSNLSCNLESITSDELLAPIVKTSPYIIQVYDKTIDNVGNKVIRVETPDKRTTYWVQEVQN
jgi:formamidopyrimidine-DNA glycosylase